MNQGRRNSKKASKERGQSGRKSETRTSRNTSRSSSSLNNINDNINNSRMRSEVDRLVDSYQSTVTKLRDIWEEIGLIDSEVWQRTTAITDYTINDHKQMMREEENMRDQLYAEIDTLGEEVLTLTEQLNLPKFELEDDNIVLIELKNVLSNKWDELKKEKETRLSRLTSLQEKQQRLCDCLCVTPYYIPSTTVPSQQQMDELQTHINKLTAEKDKKLKEYKGLRDDILELYGVLDFNPETTLQRDLTSPIDSSISLSNDIMRSIKQLHAKLEQKQHDNEESARDLRSRIDVLRVRLDVNTGNRQIFDSTHRGCKPAVLTTLKNELARLEVLKLQNLQKFIDATKRDLDYWLDKCYMCTDIKIELSSVFDDIYTEECLERYESEVCKMKLYYNENKDIIDMITRQTELWAQKVDFEVRACNPTRLNNRGGALLREEKLKKQIMKELPKVEKNLHQLVSAWEDGNNQLFLVRGRTLSDFIQYQKEEYESQKEQEKQDKIRAKARTLKEEMTYGSKPNTTMKRQFNGTPIKASSKLRKLDPSKSGSIKLTFAQSSSSSACKPPTGLPPNNGKRVKPSNAATQRRRSRRILGVRSQNDSNSMSTTRVGGGPNCSAASIASTFGSYTDFTKELQDNTRIALQSSIIQKRPGTMTRTSSKVDVRK